MFLQWFLLVAVVTHHWLATYRQPYAGIDVFSKINRPLGVPQAVASSAYTRGTKYVSAVYCLWFGFVRLFRLVISVCFISARVYILKMKLDPLPRDQCWRRWA